MLDVITKLINHGIYNNQHFLQQFILIAETITKEYVEDSVYTIAKNEALFSMAEIMQKVEVLNKELRLKAIWCKDTYKEGKGRSSLYLGRNCNKIIKRCITQYISQVTTVNKIQLSMIDCN